ncbi:MAG TPA: fluoride efflux transporter CrcB [Gammaproteobacteria bacterium]|nr:fluoride efflux transporter CrcB [Gammaproteobacteria bacterium]
MTQLLMVGAGGALGAIGRYLLSTWVYSLTGRAFPWGTLAVNLLGSLLIGFLSVWLLERMTLSTEMRALLMVGFLGAFTTFSTFSLETLLLLEEGAVARAGVNVAASVIICIFAAWMGTLIAKAM